MARKTEAAYELTDAEQRDVIERIQAGEPLDDRYRFIVFRFGRDTTSLTRVTVG